MTAAITGILGGAAACSGSTTPKLPGDARRNAVVRCGPEGDGERLRDADGHLSSRRR